MVEHSIEYSESAASKSCLRVINLPHDTKCLLRDGIKESAKPSNFSTAVLDLTGVTAADALGQAISPLLEDCATKLRDGNAHVLSSSVSSSNPFSIEGKADGAINSLISEAHAFSENLAINFLEMIANGSKVVSALRKQVDSERDLSSMLVSKQDLDTSTISHTGAGGSHFDRTSREFLRVREQGVMYGANVHVADLMDSIRERQQIVNFHTSVQVHEVTSIDVSVNIPKPAEQYDTVKSFILYGFSSQEAFDEINLQYTENHLLKNANKLSSELNSKDLISSCLLESQESLDFARRQLIICRKYISLCFMNKIPVHGALVAYQEQFKQCYYLELSTDVFNKLSKLDSFEGKEGLKDSIIENLYSSKLVYSSVTSMFWGSSDAEPKKKVAEVDSDDLMRLARLHEASVQEDEIDWKKYIKREKVQNVRFFLVVLARL